MNIEILDPMRFEDRLQERDDFIHQASAAPLPATYPPNALAAALHPARLHVIVDEVKVEKDGTKRYVLMPDPDSGTTSLAYFTAGQFISVFVPIDDVLQNRPYSLASSPEEALAGRYEIAVQPVPGGTVSTWIHENWSEGSRAVVSSAAGSFDYNPLRDAAHVVACAGGTGVTPFVSMAKAVAEGTDDYSLTILYGARTEDNLLFRDTFAELTGKDSRIRVVYVLSDEEKEGFAHGRLTADIIREHAPAGAEYSVFVSGPLAMHEYLNAEVLPELKLRPKFIRRDLLGELHDPRNFVDYPQHGVPDEVSITVSVRDRTWTVRGSTTCTVEQILEQNGISVPNRCRSGICGFCHSRLIDGDIYVPAIEDGRRMADKRFGYIHPCATFPLSDLTLEVPHTK